MMLFIVYLLFHNELFSLSITNSGVCSTSALEEYSVESL